VATGGLLLIRQLLCVGLVLAGLAVPAAGCGSTKKETAAPSATTGPTANQTTASEGERDVITSPAGFEPAASFTATGRGYTIAAEAPDSFTVTFSGPSGQIVFANDRVRFLDPGSEQSGGRVTPVEIDTSVDGVATWFQEHPHLATSEPTPVTIGGADGVVLELVAARPYDHPACGSPRCVFLWSGLDGTYGLPDDDRARLYVLDVNGETVMLLVASQADGFDEFAADADEMLATLSFG
jgi:hypothetical protein